MALTKVNSRMIEKNIVNVKDYGAVGDGTTDDTAAIQSAVDDLTSNGVLYFPPSKYNIRARIYIQDLNNISIIGDGVEILATVQPSQLEFTNINGLTIEGITFDCNNYVTGACVVINSSDVRVFNCRFIHSGDGGGASGSGYGFVHNTTSSAVGTKRSGLLVDGCIFADGTRDGLQTKSVDDVVVSNCVFRDWDQTGMDHHAFGGGVAVGERITVSNCTFDNCGNAGTHAAISCFNKQATIDGNVIANGECGVLFGGLDGVISNNRFENMADDVLQTINTSVTQELLITGNYLELSGGTRLITLFDNNDPTDGPLYANITNNIIEGSGTSLIHFRRAGGTLRFLDNIYANGFLYLTVYGSIQPDIELRQTFVIELDDAEVSGSIGTFFGSGSGGDFGGVIVHVQDVTDFNQAFFGSCAYSQVNTTVAKSDMPDKGANILFRDYEPSTLSAGNVQLGTNATGQFKIRNDSGSTKRFRVTFER